MQLSYRSIELSIQSKRSLIKKIFASEYSSLINEYHIKLRLIFFFVRTLCIKEYLDILHFKTKTFWSVYVHWYWCIFVFTHSLFLLFISPSPSLSFAHFSSFILSFFPPSIQYASFTVSFLRQLSIPSPESHWVF